MWLVAVPLPPSPLGLSLLLYCVNYSSSALVMNVLELNKMSYRTYTRYSAVQYDLLTLRSTPFSVGRAYFLLCAGLGPVPAAQVPQNHALYPNHAHRALLSTVFTTAPLAPLSPAFTCLYPS